MKNLEEAKKQTFGVEVEMNNITRKEAARLAAEYILEPEGMKIPQAETGTSPGAPG